MTPLLIALLAVPAGPTARVPSFFARVAPQPLNVARTPGQDRAVVLIHGLSVALLNPDRVTTPRLRVWQQSDSTLVRRLSKDSDVFAFAYAQTAPVEKVSELGELPGYVRTLKKLGYKEIVLVGHSAGGLIARHLVEDQPSLGVTKVIQVCAPNMGSGLASLKAARSVQVEFLSSLTKAARAKTLEDRASRKIPAKVEFATVVSSFRTGGDGVVLCKSQWCHDLQEQGVPAYPLRATHWDAVRSAKAADLIGRLVVERQPRWSPTKVREARKELLGD